MPLVSMFQCLPYIFKYSLVTEGFSHLFFKGTYEYGKQLLQAALVLRRSLRFDIEPNHERAQRLEEAWKRFSKGTSERANRLTVLALFLNESDKVRHKQNDRRGCSVKSSFRNVITVASWVFFLKPLL